MTLPAQIALAIMIGWVLTVVTMTPVMMVAHDLGVLSHVTGKILVWGSASLWIMLSMAALYSSNYKEHDARRASCPRASQ